MATVNCVCKMNLTHCQLAKYGQQQQLSVGHVCVAWRNAMNMLKNFSISQIYYQS